MSVLAQRTRGALTLAWVLASIGNAACLPLGEPPSGRHLLAARDLEDVGFLQPALGQRAPIVTLRSKSPYDQTLCQSYWSFFAVDDTSAATGLATERLLADHAERGGPIGSDYQGPRGSYGGGYDSGASSFVFRTDARGRVYIAWQPTTPALPVTVDGFETFQCPPGNGRLALIDPTTGERAELGSSYGQGFFGGGPQSFGGGLSADRARVVFTSNGTAAEPHSEVVLRGVDDREIRFAGTSPLFVGNDLYALGDARTLVKVDASGVPRHLLSNVYQFGVETSARGPVLQIQTGDMTSPGPWVLFDPATETLVPLPTTTGQGYPSLSPSGRFVMYGTYDPSTNESQLYLIDRDTGATERRGSVTQGFTGSSAWRPGKDEYWLEQSDDRGGTLTRWTPGGPTVTDDIGPGYGYFSEDGRYWFRNSFLGTGTEARDPDNPGAPGYQLNPPGADSSLAPRTLPDGRLLVQAGVTSGIYEIYVADPVARTSRPIASGGTVVAIGRTRVLALLKVIGQGRSGELSLIDLETGAKTLLAENAYRQVVEPPKAGEDPLGPGLRVLALVRNRFASPYDGLWLSILP